MIHKWIFHDLSTDMFISHNFMNKGAQICDLAVIKVQYLVTEGGRNLSPYHLDRLGWNPLNTLWPHKIKRLVWFIDKVKVEPIIPRI